MMNILSLIVVSLFSLVNGDVYLHNPRGNNNRCDERSNNRNNANRLFDSQNNAAGGYAVPCNRPDGATTQNDINCYQMNYYTDTVIPIRWTSQHNCGENNDCQFIIQYACQDELGVGVRNGHPQNSNGNTCTNRVPEQPDQSLQTSGDNIDRYGMNEDYAYYQRCKNRQRNPHLFTADQRLRGSSSIYTRQNPNGNRYGFECPEERDYYPYWSETDWVDIAVLTTNTSRCPHYELNSRCNVDKHECIGTSTFPLNQTDCELQGGLWYTYPQFTDCNFTCIDAPSSIINRLGIGINSTSHTHFHWRLPSVPRNNCVLRLRYNISTSETPWEFTNLDNNKLSNNPVMNTSQGVPVRLAINTAQYGRTFEDRTYTFNIIPRPQDLQSETIHNVNVQGKRGNIAQVRNCIEYDFVPNKLLIHQNEYVHFQFIGSDFNPPGNDGEGRAGTDRNNVVLIESYKSNVPFANLTEESVQLFTDDVMMLLATLGQDINNQSQCFNYTELTRLNRRNDQQSLRNCALLNRAEPYFNLSPRKPFRNGTMKAMNSRNNNFSNRGQKLNITVLPFVNRTIINTEIETESSSSLGNSGENDNDGKIVAIVLSVLVVIGLIIGYVNRNAVSKCGQKTKEKIRQNTASYI